MSDEQPTQQFAIQRIYLKDLSFELPAGAALFGRELSPKIKMDLNTRHAQLEEDRYEVVLEVTVTATQDDETVFIVEVQQAGLFRITQVPENAMDQVLRSFCPNILFPYVRETVDNVAVRGGLPPLQLSPVNFDALYQQAREQQDASATSH